MKDYDLLIENAAVLTMDAEDTVIEDGVIGIKNGVISLLEKQSPGVCYQADEHIDAKGMLAFPASLIHTYTAFSRFLKDLVQICRSSDG